MLRFALVPIVLSILLALAGCRNEENLKPEPKKRESKKRQVTDSPVYGGMVACNLPVNKCTLDPLYSGDAVSDQVISFMFNGLIGYDKNLNPIPDLAETWEVSSNGKEIDFTLRKDVVWHDGSEFNANDITFTYAKYLEPESNPFFRNLLSNVTTIEVLDPYNIKVKYKEASYLSLHCWKIPVLPANSYTKTGFETYPVGTGPFRIIEMIPTDRILMEANTKYYKGKPFLDQLHLRFITDKSVAFLALLNGELDIMPMKADYYVKQCNTPQFKEKFWTLRYSMPDFFTMLILNMDRPPLNELAVRKAITHAINVDAIIQEVMHGFGQRVSGPIGRTSIAYDETVKPIPYSIEQAHSLLREAGYTKKNEHGILFRDGKELAFNLAAVPDNSIYSLVHDLIAKQLFVAGIRAKKKLYSNENMNTMLENRDFTTALTGWVLDEMPQLYVDWHTQSIPTMDNKFSGYNYSGLRDPDLDSLLEKSLRTAEPDKLNSLYYGIHRKVADSCPAVFLFSSDALVAVSKRLYGTSTGKTGLFHNPERWYVREGEL